MSKIEKALHKAASERSKKKHEPGQETSVQSLIYTKTLVQSTMSLDLLERERLLGGTKASDLTNNINILRTQILQKTRSMGWTTIMVTSPNSNVGKSTIAINLAISIARELNHTALLVDTCLNKPGVAQRLGLDDLAGLSDHLSYHTPLENLLVNPGLDKLVVLPSGSEVSNPAELLGSSTMKKLVTELKHRYADRYIIFDSSHIIGASDALVFSEYVDTIVLVVGDSETKKDDLDKTLELLHNRNVIGIVLNKVR